MSIALVVPTHNRLEYTRKVIPHLLEDQKEEFDLYLWDNASTDGTVEYLKNEVNDPRIVEVVLNKENVGQTGAMNYVWSKTKAELVGKVDNDCLVTPGWTRTFAQAHIDIPELGVVTCWHFPLDDFDYERAKHKIQTLGKHQIFRHPWTCGSGFILKKKTFTEMGPWEKGSSVGTTRYFIKIALAGYINGWYYPLILQEHMDDPKSSHSRFHYLSFYGAYKDSYGYKNKDIRDFQRYMKIRKQIIHNLMSAPYEPKHYVGWRVKYRRLLGRIRKLLRPVNE
jgi:GT2 family glycosyltransferase